MINVFTEKPVSTHFLAAFSTQPLQSVRITPEDTLFYAVNSENAHQSNPFMTESSESVSDISAYRIDISDTVVDELKFLDSLCLVLYRPDSIAFIHPAALTVLYDVPNGLFARYTSYIQAWCIARADAFKPFRTLLLTYVLPGRYWRARSLYTEIADNTELSGRLKGEMMGAEALWRTLTDVGDKGVVHVPMPMTGGGNEAEVNTNGVNHVHELAPHSNTPNLNLNLNFNRRRTHRKIRTKYGPTTRKKGANPHT